MCITVNTDLLGRWCVHVTGMLHKEERKKERAKQGSIV